jgi:hypothetical protein
VAAFARRAGYEIEAEFYDAAVSGADPIDARPGFAALLARIAGNGVKVVIVETANRFARDLIVQETEHKMLRNLGIELIAADSPDSLVDDTPTAVMVRQTNAEASHNVCVGPIPHLGTWRRESLKGDCPEILSRLVTTRRTL